MIFKLQYLLNKYDKKYLIFLVIFSIIISVIETIGISVIMPFVSVATDFENIHNNKYFTYIYEFFYFKNEISFILAFGFILVLFYIFRTAINLGYIYALNKFISSRYHSIAYKLFKKYMELSYNEFTKKNSSSMTKAIISEAANLTSLISSLLLMISEIFVLIFIYLLLLYINYKITFFLTLFLILNVVLMLKVISKRIKRVGIIRAEVQSKFYEIINKSFGNFKLIKLQLNDNMALDEFNKEGLEYADVNIKNSTLSMIPKLFLEGIAFSVIIIIIMYLIWDKNGQQENIMAMISVFVLGLYRLMPSLNRIMTSYNSILFQYKSLEIIHNELMYNSENLGNEKLNFRKDISLENISFEYEVNKPVLSNINLTIKKGSKIAFIGESGSGKSTLVDIIIGLYKPKEGRLTIDNKEISDNNVKSLRLKVGYIPQFVYLFDGTVGENISFQSTYDIQKINDCLKKAKIFDFLNTKEGHNTFVGEGGIMLSGGQKQRIAIARALYTNPEILVLDEATSALDDETEEEIMNEIYEISKDKTLIIIAHRLSTIQNCEKIYCLENGNIK